MSGFTVCLPSLLAFVLVILYRQIAMLIFDRDFSKSAGLAVRSIDSLLFVLLVLAIVIGIRSVGVVLMAGMLIAPAVAARALSHRLWAVFLFAAAIGAVSGFMGNYLSVEIPNWGKAQGWDWKFSLPTGPMILLSASAICLFFLFFAPQNGLASRLWRIFRFRQQCRRENLLKFLWRSGPEAKAAMSEIQTVAAAILLSNLETETARMDRREAEECPAFDERRFPSRLSHCQTAPLVGSLPRLFGTRRRKSAPKRRRDGTHHHS